MKRFFAFVFTVILLATTCLFTASAEEPDPIVIDYGDITVIFDGNTTLDEDQRMAIVLAIAGEHSGEHICRDDPSRNIICNIFGHNKVEEPLIVIEHCVREEQPRCRENVGTLTTCTRCDYNDFVVEASTYIFCH